MGHNSVEYIHIFTEAKKLAYEDRAKYYADMNFADVPIKELISKEYALERNKLIDLKKLHPPMTLVFLKMAIPSI